MQRARCPRWEARRSPVILLTPALAGTFAIQMFEAFVVLNPLVCLASGVPQQE